MIDFSEPLHTFPTRVTVQLFKPGTTEPAGTCSFQLQVLQIPSFLDYLTGGMKIQMHYAIDYNHFDEEDVKEIKNAVNASANPGGTGTNTATIAPDDSKSTGIAGTAAAAAGGLRD